MTMTSWPYVAQDTTDLAYHIALHFPEHGVTLLRADSVDTTPTLPEQLIAPE